MTIPPKETTLSPKDTATPPEEPQRHEERLVGYFLIAQIIAFISLIPCCNTAFFYWGNGREPHQLWITFAGAAYATNGPISALALFMRLWKRPWVRRLLIVICTAQLALSIASLAILFLEEPYRPLADHGALNVVGYVFASFIVPLDLARGGIALRLAWLLRGRRASAFFSAPHDGPVRF